MKSFYKENITNYPSIVYSDTQPSGFSLITDVNEVIYLQRELYKERRRQGLEYSDTMDARLIVLGNGIPNAVLSEQVRSILDIMFNNARYETSLGRWVSAKREIDIVQENETLEYLINTYSLPINQAGLIQEVKDRINLAIEELY